MYEKVFAKAKEFTKTDPLMDERLARMADHTWDMIGGDVLQCMGDESAVMERDEVIEVVCDADHMLSHGNDPDAYAYYIFLRDSGKWKHINKVMKEAFPYKKYGW